MFEQALFNLNKNNDPDALVRISGFREETFVTAGVLRKWFWATTCPGSSMNLGMPLSSDSGSVIAVLYLGTLSETQGDRSPPSGLSHSNP
jgi:hypothetical protein